MTPRKDVDGGLEARVAAVDAIDCYLQAAADMPTIDDSRFSEDVKFYSSLGASTAIERSMPRWGDYRLEPFANDWEHCGIEHTPSDVRDFALYYLRTSVLYLADLTATWIFESLRDAPDPEIFDALREIVERHWRAHPDFAESMFAFVGRRDHAKTVPLMRRIASDPEVPGELFAQIMRVFQPAPLSTTPDPWERIDLDPSVAIPDGPNARARALQALDRLIKSTDEMPENADSELPIFVRDEWPTWNRRVEAAMPGPTLGHFYLEPIIELFEERLGDRSEAIDLAFRYGQRRLRELVLAAAKRTQSWLLEILRAPLADTSLGTKPGVESKLFRPLREVPDLTIFHGLRAVLERRWPARRELLEPLLACLLELDPAATAEWAEHLEGSPELAAAVRELSR